MEFLYQKEDNDLQIGKRIFLNTKAHVFDKAGTGNVEFPIRLTAAYVSMSWPFTTIATPPASNEEFCSLMTVTHWAIQEQFFSVY